MNCDEVRDSLSELADGALEQAAEARVRAHIAGCAGCRAELRELEETVKLLNGLEPVPVPEDLLPRIRETLAQKQDAGRIRAVFSTPQFRVAAAACLVCAFCIYGYIYLEGPAASSGPARPGGDTAKSASAPAKSPSAEVTMAKQDGLRPEEAADFKQKTRNSGWIGNAEHGSAEPQSAAAPELPPRKGLADADEPTAARDKATAPADRERFGGRHIAAESQAPAGGGTYADLGLEPNVSAETPAPAAMSAGGKTARFAAAEGLAAPTPVGTEGDGKIWREDREGASGRGEADRARSKLKAAGVGGAGAADDSMAAAAPAMGPAPASPATRPAPVESKHEAMLKEASGDGKKIDQLSSREVSEVAAGTVAPEEQAAPANEPAAQPCLTVTTRKHRDEVQTIIDKFAVADEKDLEKALSRGSIVAAAGRQPAGKAVTGEVAVRIKAADYPRLIEQLRTVGSVTDERPPAVRRAVAGETSAAEQPETEGETILIRIRIVQK